MTQEKFYFENQDSCLNNQSYQVIENVLYDYHVKRLDCLDIYKKYPVLEYKSPLSYHLPFTLSEERCTVCNELLYTKLKRFGLGVKEVTLCRNCFHNNTTTKISRPFNPVHHELPDEEMDAAWEVIMADFQQKTEWDDLSLVDLLKILFIINRFHAYQGEDEYLYFPKPAEKHSPKINREDLQIIQYLIRKKLIKPYSYTDRQALSRIVDNHKGIFKTPYEFYWIQNIYFKGKHCDFQNLSESPYINWEKVQYINLWKYIFNSELTLFLKKQSMQTLRLELSEDTITYTAELLWSEKNLSKAFAVIQNALYTTENAVYLLNSKQGKSINAAFIQIIEEQMSKYQASFILADFEGLKYKDVSNFSKYVMQMFFNIDKEVHLVTLKDIINIHDQY